MIEEISQPKRKSNRIPEFNYSGYGGYFITICTQDMQHLFGKIESGDKDFVGDAVPGVPKIKLSKIGKVVHEVLLAAKVPNVEIEKFVIMPNHLHLMLFVSAAGTPGTASPTKHVIPKFVNSMKAIVSKRIGFSPWQRSFYDRVIRNDKDYARIWEYIENNPLQWDIEKFYNE